MSRPKTPVQPPPAFVIQRKGVAAVPDAVVQTKVATNGPAPFFIQAKPAAVNAPVPVSVRSRGEVKAPALFRPTASKSALQSKLRVPPLALRPSISTGVPVFAQSMQLIPKVQSWSEVAFLTGRRTSAPPIQNHGMNRAYLSALTGQRKENYSAATRMMIQRAAITPAVEYELDDHSVNLLLFEITRSDGGEKESTHPTTHVGTRDRHAEVRATDEMWATRTRPHAWRILINAAPCDDCDQLLQRTANKIEREIRVDVVGAHAGYVGKSRTYTPQKPEVVEVKSSKVESKDKFAKKMEKFARR